MPRTQKRRAGQRCKPLQLRAPRFPLLRTGMPLCADDTQCICCGWQSQRYCVHARLHWNASPRGSCRHMTKPGCAAGAGTKMCIFACSVEACSTFQGLNVLGMQGSNCGCCAQPPGHLAGWRDRLWQDHAGAPVHPGRLLGCGLTFCSCRKQQHSFSSCLFLCIKSFAKCRKRPAMPCAAL